MAGFGWHSDNGPHQPEASFKDSGILISYLDFHSQLSFLKDCFYSCQQKYTERYQIQFFLFLCLNQGYREWQGNLSMQFVPVHVCLFVFVCFYLLIFVSYQIISQGSSRLQCLILLKSLLRMKQFGNSTGSLSVISSV